MVDYGSTAYNLFVAYAPFVELGMEVIDQKYIGDFETIFIMESGARILFDELNKSFRRIIPIPSEQEYLTDDQWLKEFSRKIKRKMKIAGLTQSELADILGVSRFIIAKYINGNKMPDYLLLRKMSKVFKCSFEDITDFWYLL